MKKLIALVMTLILITLTACAGNDTAEAGKADPADTNTQAPAAPAGNDAEDDLSDNTDSGNEESGAEGQQAAGPEMFGGEADLDNMVYGEVYEVIGNLLALKLIEMPTMSFSGNAGNRLAEFEGLSEEEIAEKLQELRESMGDGAVTFNSEGAGESGGPTFFNAENLGDAASGGPVMTQRGNGAQREVQYTGEEIDVIIPVGVSVVTTSFGESGMEESEIKLETIKAGDTVMITYDEDGETVTKVTLVPSGGGGMMRIGGGPITSNGDVMTVAP